MAHFIILHQLDEGEVPAENTYIPTLFNLDSIDYIEPISLWGKTHSQIQNKQGYREHVKESIDEIYELYNISNKETINKETINAAIRLFTQKHPQPNLHSSTARELLAEYISNFNYISNNKN